MTNRIINYRANNRWPLDSRFIAFSFLLTLAEILVVNNFFQFVLFAHSVGVTQANQFLTIGAVEHQIADKTVVVLAYRPYSAQ